MRRRRHGGRGGLPDVALIKKRAAAYGSGGELSATEAV
jgi:hypothetical protein